MRRLGPEELNRLDVLYRRVAIHLAQVRTRTRDERLAVYLNGLAAAAHSLIYLPPRQSVFGKIAAFAAYGFARTIARNWPYHLASVLLLVAGAFLAYHAATHDVLAAYALLPPGDPRQPGATPEQLLDVLRAGREEGSGFKSVFASFLFTHNLQVGLVSMGLGVLAGVPTVLLLLYNGMMLGAFVALHVQAGIGLEMWAWILPHGITELSAIALCGGVGLMLGQAVINPGLKTRAKPGGRGRRGGPDGRRHCRNALDRRRHRKLCAAKPLVDDGPPCVCGLYGRVLGTVRHLRIHVEG